MRQCSGLIDDVSDDSFCVGWGILGDIFSYDFEVVQSALRPNYSVSHLLRRDSASSCEMVPLM